MEYEWVAKSIQLSLMKLGKDISHLSETEIHDKAKEAFELVRGIDVNKNPDDYLNIVYDVFGV